MDAPTAPLVPDVEAPPIDVVRGELLQVRLPLLEPFVTSFGPTASRHVLVVRLEDGGGHVGWGEAAPLDHPFYLPEFVAGTFDLMADWALPLCVRTDIRHPRDAAQAMAVIRGNTFGRAGVEAASWTLFAEREGCALRTLFGGRASRIPVGESIGIKSTIDEVGAEAELRLGQG